MLTGYESEDWIQLARSKLQSTLSVLN